MNSRTCHKIIKSYTCKDLNKRPTNSFYRGPKIRLIPLYPSTQEIPRDLYDKYDNFKEINKLKLINKKMNENPQSKRNIAHKVIK